MAESACLVVSPNRGTPLIMDPQILYYTPYHHRDPQKGTPNVQKPLFRGLVELHYMSPTSRRPTTSTVFSYSYQISPPNSTTRSIPFYTQGYNNSLVGGCFAKSSGIDGSSGSPDTSGHPGRRMDVRGAFFWVPIKRIKILGVYVGFPLLGETTNRVQRYGAAFWESVTSEPQIVGLIKGTVASLIVGIAVVPVVARDNNSDKHPHGGRTAHS